MGSLLIYYACVIIKAMSNEKIKQKFKELHFKPEGYLSSGDEDYLDELISAIKASGIDSETLVYSGFDGTDISKGGSVPRHPYIFAMNEAGWRNAIKYRETNPAQYAEGWETPCIGLYDKHQLAQAYSYGIKLEDVNERIELSKIDMGAKLDELPHGPVEEAVVHKNYPHASPTDALVAIVYLEPS